MQPIGLGNIRILTNFAQKSPQTLLLYICKMDLVMPAHQPTKWTYTFGGETSSAIFRRCYGFKISSEVQEFFFTL